MVAIRREWINVDPEDEDAENLYDGFQEQLVKACKELANLFQAAGAAQANRLPTVDPKPATPKRSASAAFGSPAVAGGASAHDLRMNTHAIRTFAELYAEAVSTLTACVKHH